MGKYQRLHASLLRDPSRILCGTMVRVHVSHDGVQRSCFRASTGKLSSYECLDSGEIHRFVDQNIGPFSNLGNSLQRGRIARERN